MRLRTVLAFGIGWVAGAKANPERYEDLKHVAEIHGASDALESELGRGSIFTASIPAVHPSPREIASTG
jgi:hypothetical protein